MIDWVAIAWVASSIVLLVFGGLGTLFALSDVRAWMGQPHNGHWALGWDGLRIQGAFLTAGIGWTYLGVPRLFDAAIIVWSEAVGFLLGINVLMAVVSAWSWLTRREDQKRREAAIALGQSLRRRSTDRQEGGGEHSH